MDAILTFLYYPFYLTISYIKFIAASLILLLPAIFDLLLGSKSFSFKRFDYLFSFLNGLPLGNVWFSGIVCFFAPYTASIGATVTELTQEKCTISIQDQPWLRNPFGSIHAVALANLGEYASGLLMTVLLQRYKIRGIPTRIDTEYYKKARGKVTAKSDAVVIDTKELENSDRAYEVIAVANMYDSKGVLVAKTQVHWTLSKQPRQVEDKSKKMT